MSTRGYIGIRKNGIDKGGYNHFDSYPQGLGEELILFLSGKTFEELENLFDNIVEDTENNEAWDWYGHKFNEKFCFDNEFLIDSIFCEYAYIVNLDEKVVEFYKGFNKNRYAEGRYANLTCDKECKYFGVSLEGKFSLEEFFSSKFVTNKRDGFVKK